MIDAATSPCFTISKAGRREQISLQDLMRDKHVGTHFMGPTPFLESIQLFTASLILADILKNDVDPNESDLDAVARLILGRMTPGRFALDGDMYRYMQVPLAVDVGTIENKEFYTNLSLPALEGTFFQGIATVSDTGLDEEETEAGEAKPPKEAAFNFGTRPHCSPDGFCPSCALIGLVFCAKCAPGTGGKVAGQWQSGLMTFPIFESLRDTLIVSALAWSKTDAPGEPPEWFPFAGNSIRDPWTDDVYLAAVANGGPWDQSFKTMSHIRAWTPWALWLQWEEKPSICTLCNLRTPIVAVGATGPKKIIEVEEVAGKIVKKSKYTGKFGWPKKADEKGTMLKDAIPNPFMPNLKTLPKRTDLLSEAHPLLSGSDTAARVLRIQHVDEFENIELQQDEIPRSVLVAGLFNDHKSVGTFTYTVHIPLRNDPNHLANHCSQLYDVFVKRGKQFELGLFQAMGHEQKADFKKHTTRVKEEWSGLAQYFTEFLDIHHSLPEWETFLRNRALRLYDQATAHLYGTGYIKDPKNDAPISIAKKAAFGRFTVLSEVK